MAEESGGRGRESILGLSTDELAGLTVEELTNNETAIKMVFHYYKQLVDENTSLRNEVNTLRTYVSAYDTTKSNSATGAILLALSNISIGFGVNLPSNQATGNVGWWSIGWWSIGIGVAVIAAGIYFSFFKDKR